MDVDDLFDAAGEPADGAGAVTLRVHVQPAAGRSVAVGRHGSALKVRIAAPPVGGRANEACAELLAETFSIPTRQVELVGGATSRSKSFRLSGLDLDDFRRELERLVSDDRPGSNPRSPSRA